MHINSDFLPAVRHFRSLDEDVVRKLVRKSLRRDYPVSERPMTTPPFFLKEELKQHGIATYIPSLVQHQVLDEISYALSPVIHEGKLKPYGFIVLNSTALPNYESICSDADVNLAQARQIADGCHSFSMFKEGQFKGVVMLRQDAQHELQLVQLQQELQSIICTTDSSGITKIFYSEGVFIHQYRNWQHKPSVMRALQSISRCVPQANPVTLGNILAFCFYDLSPRKIGTTLVWCLVEPTVEELGNMQPSFRLKQIHAQVGDQQSLALLRHLLAYSDGAAILNPQAQVLGVGAQLKYSDASRQIIEAHAGTRHTSAQRLSYDCANTLVFVVSSDGPVTVFSDGMSVTDLKVDVAGSIPTEVRDTFSQDDGERLFCSHEHHCQTCKKKLKIQESRPLEPGAKAELFCPVCGNLIYPVSYSYLYAYVVKELTAP